MRFWPIYRYTPDKIQQSVLQLKKIAIHLNADMLVFIFIFYLNAVGFLLTEQMCSAYGQMVTRETMYTAYKNHVTGKGYCSSTTPNQILNVGMSKGKCVLQCLATRCAGVNWKEPDICEVFYEKPENFSTVGSCTYFRPST